MGRVIVMNQVTLDGVMQGPGRHEDTRDGFAHGGWAVPRSDEAMAAKMGEQMGGDRAFLFGRRTYEDLLASWNAQGGPFKEALNHRQRHNVDRRGDRQLRAGEGLTGLRRWPASPKTCPGITFGQSTRRTA